jgi:hypothetical protein
MRFTEFSLINFDIFRAFNIYKYAQQNQKK